MDRDGLVEFVQWSFVEWKTKGSKVPLRVIEVPSSRPTYIGMRLHNPCMGLV